MTTREIDNYYLRELDEGGWDVWIRYQDGSWRQINQVPTLGRMMDQYPTAEPMTEDVQPPGSLGKFHTIKFPAIPGYEFPKLT